MPHRAEVPHRGRDRLDALASWVITGDDWRTRIASWIPDHGVDAWVQRDVADPALYVGTWLRDMRPRPRDPASAELADRWLRHLDRSGVTGIGFGFVFLRRTDEPTDLLAEELGHSFDDPLGPEADDYLRRTAWLRDHDLTDERFSVAVGAALERVATLDPDTGWQDVVMRIHRPDGPRWSHEIDTLGQALLAGLRPDGLTLGEITDLLSVATGDDQIDITAVERLVDGLVRHGIVLPARWNASCRGNLRALSVTSQTVYRNALVTASASGNPCGTIWAAPSVEPSEDNRT